MRIRYLPTNPQLIRKPEHFKKFPTSKFYLDSLLYITHTEPTFNSLYNPLVCRKPTAPYNTSHQLGSRFHRYVEPPRVVRNPQPQPQPPPQQAPRTSMTMSQQSAPRYPIITVTEHTPTPSPDYLRRQVGIFWLEQSIIN